MDAYVMLLRLIHITAAVFWVGATLLFAFFIEPTVRELGPAGGAFMGSMVQKRRFPIVMMWTSLTAILAGALLYWRNTAGFQNEWVESGSGITFTVGALAAIAAWVLGFTLIRPAMAKMGQLRAASDPDMNALEGLAARVGTVSRVNVVLLLLATAAMAIARYV